MLIFLATGMVAGIFIRPLLVPWALASCLFFLNYSISLVFMKAVPRLPAAAATGVALVSFLLRFGLLALALIGVAVGLKQYFLTTAVCFLLVYTLFLGLEIAVGLKGRPVPGSPAAGGDM